MTTFSQYSGALGANVLSVALIGPEEQRRKLVSATLAASREYTVQEYPFYPDLEDVPGLLEQNFDVVMVDLDSDPEYALSLVASVCTVGSATVMVYSGQADSRLLMRCMRAGAREFLTLPISAEMMAEALAQVTGRRKDAPAVYAEPSAAPAESRPYEPVGGVPSQEVRSYEPGGRAPTPEAPSRGLYPNFDPGVRSRNQEVGPARPELRPYEAVAGAGISAGRTAVPETRSYGVDPRAYEPVAGIPVPAARTTVSETRSYSADPRSYEPVAGVANPIPRTPSPELRSYEPTAGIANPGSRAAASEARPYGAEARSYEPAGGMAAPVARTSAPETRQYGGMENRSYESGAAAANPGTRILNPSTRPSSRGGRLPNHGPRFSNPDVRATNPEVRGATAEVRPAVPEVRVVSPEIRPAVSEARAVNQEVHPPKRSGGKILVFLGAKGGSGTTSIACNFSSCLAHESGKKTLLIDLHLPLGNVALELGVKPQYSIVDALRNAARLDSNFLSKLLVKHRSGLSVLASPDKFTPVQTSKESIEKLLTTARQEFDYVVVDVGARLDLSELTGTPMLEESATVYLITQDNVAELRNSNRLITEYFSSGGPKLEIVLNRYTPRISGIGMYSSHLVDEKHIGAALTKSPEWRIPQDTSDILLPVEGSPVSRMFQNMAREVCDLAAIPESKKREKQEQTVSLFK